MVGVGVGWLLVGNTVGTICLVSGEDGTTDIGAVLLAGMVARVVDSGVKDVGKVADAEFAVGVGKGWMVTEVERASMTEVGVGVGESEGGCNEGESEGGCNDGMVVVMVEGERDSSSVVDGVDVSPGGVTELLETCIPPSEVAIGRSMDAVSCRTGTVLGAIALTDISELVFPGSAARTRNMKHSTSLSHMPDSGE